MTTVWCVCSSAGCGVTIPDSVTTIGDSASKKTKTKFVNVISNVSSQERMQRTILFAAALYKFKEGKDCLQNILDFSQGYVVTHLNPMMPNATVQQLKVEFNNTRIFSILNGYR